MAFVLGTRPDLILAFSHIVSGDADQRQVDERLNEIAPTVVLANNPNALWPQATVELAQPFGERPVSEEVDSAVAEINEACAPLREAIGHESVMLIENFEDLVFLIGVGTIDGDLFDVVTTRGRCGSHHHHDDLEQVSLWSPGRTDRLL